MRILQRFTGKTLYDCERREDIRVSEVKIIEKLAYNGKSWNSNRKNGRRLKKKNGIRIEENRKMVSCSFLLMKNKVTL